MVGFSHCWPLLQFFLEFHLFFVEIYDVLGVVVGSLALFFVRENPKVIALDRPYLILGLNSFNITHGGDSLLTALGRRPAPASSCEDGSWPGCEADRLEIHSRQAPCQFL